MMSRKFTQFLALLAAALAVIPSSAHLAAMPNKIGMSQSDYFVAQSIYFGWSVLGVLWLAAILASAALAVVSRKQVWPLSAAVAAAALFGLMFVVFFIWTAPANQATENWTSVPPTWDALRQQWEYSHALNALIGFVAFCLICLSVLSWQADDSKSRYSGKPKMAAYACG
jgi:hypothetical protein